MLALTSQFFMSGIWATAMPARTVSPSCNTGSGGAPEDDCRLVFGWMLQ